MIYMTTTEIPTQYAAFHIEYWGERTGQEVLFHALRSAGVTDGCHVYNPQILPIADDECEVDLWFSTTVESEGHFMDMVTMIREGGLRVKTACFLHDMAHVARGTMADLNGYMDELLRALMDTFDD